MIQRPYSLTIPKYILCPFLEDFANLKVTHILIGYTIGFSQSETVLLSNVSKDRKKKKKKISRAA